MCGFIAVFGPGAPLGPPILETMRDRLAHRGPDGAGAWTGTHVNGSISFGFRRLAILDTRTIADQPMLSTDTRKVVVFNGEIYNFVELRSELEAAGRQFRTRGDTEVLLQAYEHWGDAMVERLNGMFSFAIWDAARGEALIARDRFGEKPLFMCKLPGGYLAFASEIKALLAHPDATASYDMEIFSKTMSGHLIYGIEDTMFSQVRQVKAAHKMIVGADGSIRKYVRYWAPVYDKSLQTQDKEELIAQFRQKLEKSVEMRMRSDVPVTACLSGGLDSSSLVALLAQDKATAPRHLKSAISARFPHDPTIDEGRFIDQVLESSSLSGYTVSPTASELVSDVRKLHWHQETIIAGPSMYLEWSVMREARKLGYKVIIDGQGADELLAGYQNYFQAFQAECSGKGINGWLTAFWNGTIRDHRLRQSARLYENSQRRFTSKDSLPLRALRAHRLKRAPALTSLYGAEGLPSDRDVGLLRFELALNLLRTSLPSNLYSGDRNSMAHGIECRYPFLDYEIVDFCTHLPDWAYIDNGWGKNILRQSLPDLLPESIRWRVDKVGFAAPQDVWLGSEEMRHWLEERIFDRSLSDVPGYDLGLIQRTWQQHRAGHADFSGALWKWASAAELLDMGKSNVWKTGLQ